MENINNITMINLFATILIAVATASYVFLTIQLVLENIKSRKLHIDPKIILDIVQDEYNPYLLMFIVENVGNGAALDIKFKLKKQINLKEEEQIKNIGFIKNGLRALSGKMKFKTVFINVKDYAKNIEIFNDLIEIDIEYTDSSKKKVIFNDNIKIDLSYLSDIKYLNNQPIYKLNEEIIQISKTLKSIEQKLK